MITFGSVFGGPELADSPVRDALKKITTVKVEDEGEIGSLNVVFHVPGSIIKPDYSGVRTATFSKKERTLMVQVSVPVEQVKSPDNHFLLNAIREAITIARSKFKRAGIVYPEAEYLSAIDRLERELAP